MNDEARIVEILRLFGELKEAINKTYVSDLLAKKTKDKDAKKEVTEYKWVVEYGETKGKRYKKYIKVEKT